MNKKQWIVVLLALSALALIYFLTPRYKLIQIDEKNYIRTEQSSSLYQRSKGQVKLHWEKIGLYAGITLLTTGVLLLVLRRKNG